VVRFWQTPARLPVMGTTARRGLGAMLVITAATLTACGGGNVTTVPVGANQLDTQFVVVGRSIYESEVGAGTASVRRSAGVTGAKLFLRGVAYSPEPNGVPIQSNFSANVLGDKNRATWSRDIETMRSAGINAIKVYNVPPPQYDGGDKINSFLDAAWNGGTNPIYVIISINIEKRGAALLDSGAVRSLIGQYSQLAETYANKPALLGISIGNELADANYRTQPAWWAAYNQIARAAKGGFAAAGEPNKLVISSEIDDGGLTVQSGEANNVAIDVWGINSYRGRTFTNLFSQLASATTKPVLLTEYGATAAYHPSVNATYTYPLDGNKTQTAQCSPNVTQSASSPTDVAELPATGGRSMAGLIDYAVTTTTLLHDSFVTDGVASGGFYFEWTDEWYKNGSDGTQHLASVPGYSGAFPGCAWDEAWFGLNRSDPGTPNVLTPRPTLDAISKVWKSES
jgi:hypothetical protein